MGRGIGSERGRRETGKRKREGERREQRFTSEWTKIWKMEAEGRKKHRQAGQSSDCKEGTEILRQGTTESGYRAPSIPPLSNRDLAHPYSPWP